MRREKRHLKFYTLSLVFLTLVIASLNFAIADETVADNITIWGYVKNITGYTKLLAEKTCVNKPNACQLTDFAPSNYCQAEGDYFGVGQVKYANGTIMNLTSITYYLVNYNATVYNVGTLFKPKYISGPNAGRCNNELPGINLCKTCFDNYLWVPCSYMYQGITGPWPGPCADGEGWKPDETMLNFTLDAQPTSGYIEVIGGENVECSLNGVIILSFFINNICYQLNSASIPGNAFKTGTNILSCRVGSFTGDTMNGFRFSKFSYTIPVIPSTFNINWDNKQSDCQCKAGAGKWNITMGNGSLAGELPYKTNPYCCGDDANEYAVTGDAGTKACCDKPTDTVIDYTCKAGVGVNWTDLNEKVISKADLNDRVMLLAAGSEFEGKEINFTVYKNVKLWFDKKIAQSSSKAWTIWKASESGTYYFKALATDGSTPEKSSGDLMVLNVENDSPLYVSILSPRPGDIYFTGEKINFTQSSYDEDDELSSLWNFGDGKTNSSYNAVYQYDLPGQKHITLNVTNSREKADTLGTSILVIDKDKSDKYIFAYISEPKDEESYGKSVKFNATETYAVYYNATTKAISCIAGKCPEKTASLTEITGTPNWPEFSNIRFKWTFSDKTSKEKNGTDGALFQRIFSTPGYYKAILEASVNPSETTETGFYSSFLEPFCLPSGEEWLTDGVLSSSLTNCRKEKVAEGSSKTCCPVGYRCEQNQCKSSSEVIGECSDYKTKTACEDYIYPVAKYDVESKTQADYCGSSTPYNDCFKSVKNCRCFWDSSSETCRSAYDIANQCGDQETKSGECIFTITEKTNCAAGFRNIGWTASWSGSGEKPEGCESNSKRISCLTADLSFFSLIGLIIAALLIIAFYFAQEKFFK